LHEIKALKRDMAADTTETKDTTHGIRTPTKTNKKERQQHTVKEPRKR
jgi:hypothetical protein